MNTKEAIEFINQHIRQSYYLGVPERMKADSINKLLRDGEKCRKENKSLRKTILEEIG